MKLVDKGITLEELKSLAETRFGQMIKAVVDVEWEVMVVDADLHADQEKYLLDHGSSQENLWGINLYPDVEGDDWIEFDSMINLGLRTIICPVEWMMRSFSLRYSLW